MIRQRKYWIHWQKVAYEGPHQYSVTFGAKDFRDALARKITKTVGRQIDPDKEICVTCGGTESMMATMMTICNPGDKSDGVFTVL